MPNSSQFSHPVLVNPDGAVRRLPAVPLDGSSPDALNEEWLQKLIQADAACLPLDEIEPGLGPFLPVCRELPTGHGPIDNLLMSPSGDIVLVETKLWKNPEARRRVLAQALDYAVALFSLDYSQFEAAVMQGLFDSPRKPESLYEMFRDQADALPEARFVDAVSRNLRLGRAVILVVGNGIRVETSRLLEGLNEYAQFQFTLALVELAIYRAPLDGAYLVQPRTLAKTEMVRRHVFEVQLQGPDRAPVVTVKEQPTAPAADLTTETYWETLESVCPGARAALDALVQNLQPLGVYAEMRRSLNLKWQPPGDAPTLNLGYITRNGQIWTDAASWFDREELGSAYVKDLAQALGVSYRPLGNTGRLCLAEDKGFLRLATVLDRLNGWVGPAKRFVDAVTKASEP